MTVPLSVLDLAPVSAGSSPRQALRNTVELARKAEEWGYHRYWLAEHHFVAVASASPITLIALVAAATSRIRVGSGAVQLGHHTSASIVEGFGTVDALHPGRLDLGIGRSGHRRAQFGAEAGAPKGAHPVDDAATGRTTVRDGVVVPPAFDPRGLGDRRRYLAGLAALHLPGAEPLDFAAQVAEIRALLDGTYVSADGVPLHAVPGEGARVQLWLFGSSGGESAELAGRLGLPFAAAYHTAPGTALEAVAAYRAAFRPSVQLAEPYVVVSADVVVAEDDATARHLASTYGHWVHSIRAGGGAAEILDPDTAAPLTPDQRRLVEDRLATQFVGSPATVVERLGALQRATGANELLVTSVTHDHAARLASHRLLAEAWGLPPAARDGHARTGAAVTP
ncbi:Limonene 1,2-monooxygenase [Nocardia farcinica]|uniref:Limonene 1,2-monooxygenase n=1 Tax=Nocardia farcinica TaxID=37329 RepID=A0A449G8X2_NOCFR|nr:LLM class flavin-dependent oxidoreductase [Nocardia farcinica]VFA95076.1 Limonene 1,2-monooxygenase [Nocardia farcinica]